MSPRPPAEPRIGLATRRVLIFALLVAASETAAAQPADAPRAATGPTAAQTAVSTATTRPATTQPRDTQSAAPWTVAELRREAEALRPIFETELVTRFLDATADLPKIAPRKLWRDADTRAYLLPGEVEKLAPDRRAALLERAADERVYYLTKYGSPLAYARALELLAQHGLSDVRGRRVLDFGYGGIGHLRLLAALGADAVGVDVDSFLPALYHEASDVGVVKGRHGHDGRVTLVNGRWPAEPEAVHAVGGAYDVILSKNTLKRGYIHPARETDERMLIKLGVDDATFVKALFDALKPGGVVLVYNLCPAAAPPDKPYIPWADGRSPFSREAWEAAGFRVLAFDTQDDEAARRMGAALGWDAGERQTKLADDLFAWYTLVERPAAP
ncbi:MAG: hypothetical protein AB7Q17_01815 [Phycisphaerae bacterium]